MRYMGVVPSLTSSTNIPKLSPPFGAFVIFEADEKERRLR